MVVCKKKVAVADAWVIIIKRKREHNKYKKRLWVHPLLAARHLKGTFVVLYSSLKEDERNFFNYFRISINYFDELHCKLEESLKFSNAIRSFISLKALSMFKVSKI
nr:unnamed protein product [Callosobruchus chinensis]